MTIHDGCSRAGVRTRSWRLTLMLATLALALALLAPASAFAITRATVLSRAQKWVDLPVPYSQSKYYGGYRTDCSGFTSMAWQTTSSGHAYSYSTRSLHNVSHVIRAADLKPGDALVKYDYHARVFYGWADEAHTTYVTYEQTGPTTKSSIKSLAADLAYGYKPYRYDRIADGLPSWNGLANPTFNVWASGSPVWWRSGGDESRAAWFRSGEVVKVGTAALGLVNASGRSADVVEVRQTAGVKAGSPYTLSVMSRTDSDPAGLELRVCFLDASGGELTRMSIDGRSAGVGATSLTKMSLTATAPAEATSATISVRLAGGRVETTQTVGTTAVIDDVRFYDPTPVKNTLSASAAKVARYGAFTLRGLVAGPLPVGTVRIYVRRPGRTAFVPLADMPLVGGAWSKRVGLTMRGTYVFSAKYMGYGPYGQVTSARVSVTSN